MKTSIALKLFIASMSIVLSACASSASLDSIPLQPIPTESLTSQSLFINGKEYNSIMAYDKNAGIIIIDFFDANNKPAKIIMAKTAKAKLVLPDSKFETIIFKNPARKSYPSGSRRAKRQLRLKPKGETIYAKDVRLKKISEFSLTVQLKTYGKIFLLTYVFHQKLPQQGLGAMRTQPDDFYT